MAVERALTARWPDAAVERLTRTSAGDRDPGAALTAFADKGAFTADLSDALLRGEADIVVHSWKDLPTEGRSGTTIAGTLERADPRDLLLVRPGLRSSRVDRLTVLSSSPRRAWLAAGTLPGLLPWPVRDVQTTPVRGNVPTRVRKLLDGDADALLVAKAAVDRLLDPDGPAEAASAAGALRAALDMCDWMVLPVRSWPAAPAQGALAFEICRGREDLSAMLRAVGHEPTREAVERERAVLAAHGGGCHAALGATVLSRPFGRVLSVRSRTADGEQARWELDRPHGPVAVRANGAIWPRPDERRGIERRPLPPPPAPPRTEGLWVSRADALPDVWSTTHCVWAAGERTWRRLAARGVWVHGCADGLGDEEAPAVDRLAGRAIGWRRLTHRDAAADDPNALATYEVARTWPDDLPARTHFFWTSGTEFRDAVTRWPALRDRWHSSGPGRTSRVIRETLGDTPRAGVWLDYDSWRLAVSA
jgi:hydroxymethylbilane synthase